jgi:hypothetical protein
VAGLATVFVGLIGLRLVPVAVGLVPILILGSWMRASLRSGHRLNWDGSAKANLRTINTAEVTHYGSASNYGSIEDLISEGLLDDRFKSTVSGYNFTVTADATSIRPRP